MRSCWHFSDVLHYKKHSICINRDMDSDGGTAGFASFIPLFLMGCILGIVSYFVGKRKGKNPLLCFFLCLIPGFNVFFVYYLATLTDKIVIDRLDYLESFLKVSKETFSAAEPILKEWVCNCGKKNSIEIQNCPECGLKKDYVMKQQNKTS
jgi:hypothetical protein